MMDDDVVEQDLTNMAEALTSIKREQASSDEQSEDRPIVDEKSSAYFLKIGVGILESKVEPVDLFVNEYNKSFLNYPCKEEDSDSSVDHDIIRVNNGVWTVTSLREGKRFGPYPETAFQTQMDPGNTGHWISSLRKAEQGESYNIETLKIGSQVFYKTTCDIPTNTELVLSASGKKQCNIDRVVRIGHQHRCPDCGKVFSMLSLLDVHKLTHYTEQLPNPIKNKSQDLEVDRDKSQRCAVDTSHDEKPGTQLEITQVNCSSHIEIKPLEKVSLENDFPGNHLTDMHIKSQSNEWFEGHGTDLTEAAHETKVKYETSELLQIEPKWENDASEENSSNLDVFTTDVECGNLSEGEIKEESLSEDHGEHSRNPVENVDLEEQECLTVNTDINRIQENLICGNSDHSDHLKSLTDTLDNHSNEEYRCQHCKKIFSDSIVFKWHQGRQCHVGQFKCNECERTFKKRGNLRQHMVLHTGAEAHHCKECGKCFPLKIQLLSHQRKHSKGNPSTCKVCGKIFKNKGNLSLHMIVHTKVKETRCEECGRSFRYECQLIAHQRIHSGEKPYRCEECGKEFRIAYNLKMHMTFHTKERPWPCEICGQCFRLKPLLRQHMVIHDDEKSHQCPECPRSFHRSYDLRTHMLCHNDVRPHKCRICQKTFRRVSHVHSHMRCHLKKPKDYKCLTCGELFSDINSYRSHKSQHTGRQLFSCPVCEKLFTGQTNLKIHERIHSGERPFSCENCGKNFKQSSHLQRHLKTHSTSTTS